MIPTGGHTVTAEPRREPPGHAQAMLPSCFPRALRSAAYALAGGLLCHSPIRSICPPGHGVVPGIRCQKLVHERIPHGGSGGSPAPVSTRAVWVGGSPAVLGTSQRMTDGFGGCPVKACRPMVPVVVDTHFGVDPRDVAGLSGLPSVTASAGRSLGRDPPARAGRETKAGGRGHRGWLPGGDQQDTDEQVDPPQVVMSKENLHFCPTT